MAKCYLPYISLVLFSVLAWWAVRRIRGVVKITDFGLAKVTSEVVDAVSDYDGDLGQGVGSLPWMAPELINQEPPPTSAADVFRFALVP